MHPIKMYSACSIDCEIAWYFQRKEKKMYTPDFGLETGGGYFPIMITPSFELIFPCFGVLTLVSENKLKLENVNAPVIKLFQL